MIKTNKILLLLITFVYSAICWSAEYYADPINGNNENDGISLSTPWLTLHHAVNQLQVGDTLHLRAGTFYESELVINTAGNAQNWITIKAWQNEAVFVDGRINRLSQPDSGAWELVDASKNIYRTTTSYDVDQVHGYLDANNGHWRLVTYENYATFSTPNELYDAEPPYYYVGPGLFYNTAEQKIYIRLQHSIYQASMELNLPQSIDPNDNGLILFDDEQVFLFESDAAYIKFENINIQYQNSAVEIKTGAHHLQFSNAKMIGGRYFMLIRDNAHDIVIDNIDFPGYIPPWIARSDVKRPRSGRPAHLMQGNAIQISDGAYNIEVANCVFDHHFDAINATKNPHHLYIHNNDFHIIRDDVLQLGSAAWQVELAHNTLTEVTAGFSWNGSGSPPANERGTIFVHHNIIDASAFSLYGRIDPNDELDDKYDGPNGDGMATGRAVGMHSKSDITGGAPWKIYHNTIVVSKDVDNRGTGVSYYADAFDPLTPHEVYNNIFIQKWDDFIMREARTHDQSQIFDGNLYFRSANSNNEEIFYRYYDQIDGTYQHYQNLPDFVGSPQWQATQIYYPPGWDTNSIEADPELNQYYQPTINSAAASGAIDLSSKNWPGLEGETFRGALAPSVNDTIFMNSFE